MTSALFGRSNGEPNADKAHQTDHDPLSDECRRVQAAQKILSGRRLRYAHLSGAIFGEPAWDLMLEVYVREASGLSATATDLQAELAQPSSTAVRWLKVLEEQGLIRRKLLLTGVELIGLTSDARSALNDYLTAVQKL